MLREETVEPDTLGLLKRLVTIPELIQFRLVGGTALSLLYGHRKSVDLDFFTDQPLEKDNLISALEDTFGKITSLNANRKHIYQCIIRNVKVDFVSVADPFLNPVHIIKDIPFADTKDLIALKLNAVKGRGVKKDFWDVAKLLQIHSFKDIFQFYHDRYGYDETYAVQRSMGYFADAEEDQDPESLDGMTWGNAKEIIKEALYNYYNKK